MIPSAFKALHAYPLADLQAHYGQHVPKVPLLINGKFRESQASLWYPVHNPVKYKNNQNYRLLKNVCRLFRRPLKKS